jgi:hypothetical protein
MGKSIIVLLALAIAGCGGGGGGGGGGAPANGLSVSPTSLTFSAADQLSPRPASQQITGTVNNFPGGTLFLRIVISGNAVLTVDTLVLTGPNSGQVAVHVKDPSTLGPGTHTGTLTISACNTDINCSGALLPGSPQTVTVTYQIGQASVPSALMPRVAAANTPGQIIIRRSGADLGTATGVTFNGTPATAFSSTSATELRVTHPALSAGVYTVSVQHPNGTLPITTPLTVVDAVGYPAAILPHPAGVQRLRGLVYDAARRSLYAGLLFTDSGTNRVRRYEFSAGTWSALESPYFPNLRDVAQAATLDTSPILITQNTSVALLDAINLTAFAGATRPSTTSTDPQEVLKGIVVTNDGNALVVGDSPNFGRLYLYRVHTNTFSPALNSYTHPVAGAPDNGAFGLFVQSGVSPAQFIDRYSASTGAVSATSLALSHHNFVIGRDENVNAPAFDRAGTRFIVPGSGPDHGVYDASSFARLGTLPTSTAAYALAPDGLRAYTFELSPCQVRAFDLGAPPGGTNQMPEIMTGGYPIAVSAPCPATTVDTQIRFLLTPGGDTGFIAGNASIAVVPLP